jgi:antitoxin CptB
MSLSNAELYRLRSDARRGLLENDLILQRFFDRYATDLSAEDSQVLKQLLALDDNDLMDLLLGRKEELEVLKEISFLPSYQKLMMQLREK